MPAPCQILNPSVAISEVSHSVFWLDEWVIHCHDMDVVMFDAVLSCQLQFFFLILWNVFTRF